MLQLLENTWAIGASGTPIIVDVRETVIPSTAIAIANIVSVTVVMTIDAMIIVVMTPVGTATETPMGAITGIGATEEARPLAVAAIRPNTGAAEAIQGVLFEAIAPEVHPGGNLKPTTILQRVEP